MNLPQEKICTQCGLSKSLDDFYNEPKSPDDKAWQCKACTKLYNAERAAKPKIVPEAKECRKCKLEKDIDEFGFDKNTKDGYASRCKTCKQGESKVWRTDNPEKARANAARWKAEHPDELAAYTLANKDKRSKQRKERHAANREKENAQNAANYALNKDKWRPTRQAWEAAHAEERRASHLEQYLLRDPEERRIRDRAWGAANPEKIRAKNTRSRARRKNAPVNDLSDAQWEETKAAFGFRCVYCPTDCKECKKKTHELTKDHVTPYSHNGSNTLWNVVPACLSCNSRKHAGPPPLPVQPLLLTISPSHKPKKKGA